MYYQIASLRMFQSPSVRTWKQYSISQPKSCLTIPKFCEARICVDVKRSHFLLFALTSTIYSIEVSIVVPNLHRKSRACQVKQSVLAEKCGEVTRRRSVWIGSYLRSCSVSHTAQAATWLSYSPSINRHTTAAQESLPKVWSMQKYCAFRSEAREPSCSMTSYHCTGRV